jgi:iron-sulfur cluster assembly protein
MLATALALERAAWAARARGAREAAGRAARSTSPGGIALPGGLPAFALVAVTGRRLLLQALPGFPIAARVNSLSGVAGVALARLTERLAHTLPVQLSCFVVVDHVVDSSLAAGIHDATCSSFQASVPGRLKGQVSIPKEHDRMLTITHTAAEAIKGIVASPQVPEGAGLRIATRPESPAEGAFEVSVAPVPAEEDQVVEESGAQVFLEPQAAEALDDKVLDAEIEGGEVRFAVGEQT